MCHMSRVTCHMSHVMCHMSCFTCHMSSVTCHFLSQKKLDNVEELVGGGSIINGAYPVEVLILINYLLYYLGFELIK